MNYTLSLTDEADDAVREAILSALRSYNVAQAGASAHRPLIVALKDDTGTVTGGLWGETGYGWLFTRLLVVPESLRGRGIGTRLLAQAEEEAIARGCRAAWLDTFSFQARGFYERLGYSCFAELEDYPPGFSRLFLQKPLHAG
ncbi:GNAT family N-acetyltransferase [Paludibacterium yongneupense]|uniref:GNAT family N-acetyltransferase n=1 Tax=Paludibacterium yongneupense TaxID=400061 RepID=UPI00040EA5CB|nr:GNAT family N-acetyltransferase [Paludibacterium yongneupense]